MANRDYETDAQYREFRKKVRARDRFKCKMCQSKEKLQVHHIIRWTDSPWLRYDVTNGITLCKECHNSIKGSEHIWASYLSKLID
jgi:5-methylcytosine-specific restriction endonuclease McrA